MILVILDINRLLYLAEQRTLAREERSYHVNNKAVQCVNNL